MGHTLEDVDIGRYTSIAGYDPLRDEGLLYGKLLAENG
jgi:hypothetical protein